VLHPVQAGLTGVLGDRVRSTQGAVSASRLVRFPGPPPEPDVPVSEHPALHKRCQLASSGIAVALGQGDGILVPR
jgi:hypothetical protein